MPLGVSWIAQLSLIYIFGLSLDIIEHIKDLHKDYPTVKQGTAPLDHPISTSMFSNCL